MGNTAIASGDRRSLYVLLYRYDDCDGWDSGDNGIVLYGVFTGKYAADNFAMEDLETTIDYYVKPDEYDKLNVYGYILLEIDPSDSRIPKNGIELHTGYTEINRDDDY